MLRCGRSQKRETPLQATNNLSIDCCASLPNVESHWPSTSPEKTHRLWRENTNLDRRIDEQGRIGLSCADDQKLLDQESTEISSPVQKDAKVCIRLAFARVKVIEDPLDNHQHFCPHRLADIQTSAHMCHDGWRSRVVLLHRGSSAVHRDDWTDDMFATSSCDARDHSTRCDCKSATTFRRTLAFLSLRPHTQ